MTCYTEEPIDVLTPIAASMLFRRSSEAVRSAARKGYVDSPVALAFTAKHVRLLDLQSACQYWSAHVSTSMKSQLADMRRFGVTIEADGERYCILHLTHWSRCRVSRVIWKTRNDYRAGYALYSLHAPFWDQRCNVDQAVKSVLNYRPLRGILSSCDRGYPHT